MKRGIQLTINVLVACEESQRVCIEFRKRGFRAFSCDIQECSGGHPEWHIQCDVLRIMNGAESPNAVFTTQNGDVHFLPKRWDAVIAFPPCTHLASSGARWFEEKRKDGRQEEGLRFFCEFLDVSSDYVSIENPIGIIGGERGYVKKYYPELSERYGLPRKPTQIIQPYEYGDAASKQTCLWLKGLPPLTPTTTVKPELEYYEYSNSTTGKAKREPKWNREAFRLPPKERAKIRSKTYPGIAAAMAEQWGAFLKKKYNTSEKSIKVKEITKIMTATAYDPDTGDRYFHMDEIRELWSDDNKNETGTEHKSESGV